MLRPAHFLVAVFAAAIAFGCSSAPAGGPSDSGSEGIGDGGGGSARDGGGQQMSDGGAQASDAGADAGIDVCQAISSKGKQQPLDMYLMLDRSKSMNEALGTSGTKWAAITAALTSFLGQSGMDGISVGLQYFPIGLSDSQQCTASNYSAPSIAIAPVADVKSAITSSINGQTLMSGTPTSAALTGAIAYAKTYAAANAQDAVIVVFATDGQPNGCVEDIAAIAAIAAAGVSGTPKILTFVIGVGSLLDNLNEIASGGGTSSAFLVTGGDVGAQFLAALNQIRGATTGCTYLLEAPDGQVLDPTKVNVDYVTSSGATVDLVQVSGKSSCAASQDAWYYDDASAPTKILLCPSTCTKVQADSSSQVNVLLGCKSVGPN